MTILVLPRADNDRRGKFGFKRSFSQTSLIYSISNFHNFLKNRKLFIEICTFKHIIQYICFMCNGTIVFIRHFCFISLAFLSTQLS
jgi:hypothetical protein